MYLFLSLNSDITDLLNPLKNRGFLIKTVQILQLI